MFALNQEKLEEVTDPNLFASSLSGTFDLLQENLGVEQNYAIMGKEPKLLISKYGGTYLWVQVKDTYPRLIEKVINVHKEAVNKYKGLIEKYGTRPAHLLPLRELVEDNLPLVKMEEEKKPQRLEEGESDEGEENT